MVSTPPPPDLGASALQQTHAEVLAYTGGLDHLLAIDVQNDSHADYAGTVVQQLADAKRAYELKRDEGLQHVRALMTWAESLMPSSALKKIDQVIDHLKKSTKRYIDAKRLEAQRALVEARSQAEVQRTVQAIVPSIPVGFVEVASFDWEMVDANAVPREYWVLDEKRLDAEVKARKAAFNVAGFKVTQGSSLRRSGRR